jgi:hypothetical protein
MSGNDGFMGFWADIDADYVLRFQQWHNCEHMPERLGIPGFIEGRRYRSDAAKPTYFMCYVTTSPDVLRSPDYLAALNRPTPWTLESLPHFRNPNRSLYRRLAVTGREMAYAPYNLLVRFDTARLPAELAGLLGQTGGSLGANARASLYEVDSEASNIITAERKIYAGGPGAQCYLLSVETITLADAEAASERVDRDFLGTQATTTESGIYWLESRISAADILQSFGVR